MASPPNQNQQIIDQLSEGSALDLLLVLFGVAARKKKFAGIFAAVTAIIVAGFTYVFVDKFQIQTQAIQIKTIEAQNSSLKERERELKGDVKDLEKAKRTLGADLAIAKRIEIEDIFLKISLEKLSGNFERILDGILFATFGTSDPHEPQILSSTIAWDVLGQYAEMLLTFRKLKAKKIGSNVPLSEKQAYSILKARYYVALAESRIIFRDEASRLFEKELEEYRKNYAVDNKKAGNKKANSKNKKTMTNLDPRYARYYYYLNGLFFRSILKPPRLVEAEKNFNDSIKSTPKDVPFLAPHYSLLTIAEKNEDADAMLRHAKNLEAIYQKFKPATLFPFYINTLHAHVEALIYKDTVKELNEAKDILEKKSLKLLKEKLEGTISPKILQDLLVSKRVAEGLLLSTKVLIEEKKKKIGLKLIGKLLEKQDPYLRHYMRALYFYSKSFVSAQSEESVLTRSYLFSARDEVNQPAPIIGSPQMPMIRLNSMIEGLEKQLAKKAKKP